MDNDKHDGTDNADGRRGLRAVEPEDAATDGADRTASLRDRARTVLAAAGLTVTALASAIGCKRASLSHWLNGTHVRATPELERLVQEWLDANDGEQESAFVTTPSADQIFTALAHAQAKHDLVCVYGSPGVGKTRAIRQYQAEHRNVWVVEARSSCATLVPALERVAAVVGIHDVVSGASRLSAAIEGKVRGRRGLLVIDEAQHLGLSAVEELRAIHDATGVGLALVGNEVVYARMTGGNKTVQFAQLFSRIGMKRYLRQPSIADVHALAGHWGVTDKRALELLGRVARQPGALRLIVKILSLASIGEASITIERIRAAMDHVGISEDA